jgi:DNA-binding MarR family transcriptional regulator
MSASKHRLYWRLQLAAHYLQKKADRTLLLEANISTAQTGVLTVISRGQDVTQKDVAVALGLNESAITAMVRKLIALKYVERRKSDKDARARILELTKLGQEIQNNVKPPFKSINNQIETVLDKGEIANLSDYLQRLTRSFEK